MPNWWKKTMAFFCCCCNRNPINVRNLFNFYQEIDEDTRLLPDVLVGVNGPTTIRGNLLKENRKIFIYGNFSKEEETTHIIDLNSLATFSTYVVKKIVFGNNHCVIQFENSKNELALLGSNENGQLGLEIKKGDIHFELNSFSSLNVLHKSELKTFEFEGTTDYEIIDISATEDFTLILIKFKNEKKFGHSNYLYRFSLDIHAKINSNRNSKNEEKNLNPIMRENFKYEQSSNIKQIYATSERIVLLTEDNSIYVKGSDFNLDIHEKYKEIVYKFEKKIKNICLGKNHLLVMSEDNSVYSMGLNQYGELGIKNKFEKNLVRLTYFELKGLTIKKIAAGSRHSLVITNDNQLYSFGDNSEGQCSGQNDCYFNPKKVKFPHQEHITDVYAGYNHSVAITSKDDVYSWGDSSSGKLGYSSDISNQRVPKLIPFTKDKIISQIFTGPMHTALVSDSQQIKENNFNLTIMEDYGAITES